MAITIERARTNQPQQILILSEDSSLRAHIEAIATSLGAFVHISDPESMDLVAVGYFIAIVEHKNLKQEHLETFLKFAKESDTDAPVILLSDEPYPAVPPLFQLRHSQTNLLNRLIEKHFRQASTNAALHALYCEWLGVIQPTLHNLKRKHPDLSDPFALYVYPDFFDSFSKLMLFGKQTNGWGPDKAFATGFWPSDLLETYRRFKFALAGYNLSPFWDFSHKLHNALNPGVGKFGFIWNNILKIDNGGEKPPGVVAQLSWDPFPVIQKELDVLKPDIVVFATGPTYDDFITQVFPDCNIVPMKANQRIARIESPNLPQLSFRIDHPKYLRLTRTFDKRLDQIIHLLHQPP